MNKKNKKKIEKFREDLYMYFVLACMPCFLLFLVTGGGNLSCVFLILIVFGAMIFCGRNKDVYGG